MTDRRGSRSDFSPNADPPPAGALDVVIPKLRPQQLWRKRAERALTSVAATCYLLGVFTAIERTLTPRFWTCPAP
ncbi:hypothetical protein [Mycobacterium interjectum]|uniref:hypothetical protein n=1 Tax=Mycobacterium interjectum TaxID=33895 RepID=UPI0011555CBE|nr:hypothetical protein [Mycobacterium interjectum]